MKTKFFSKLVLIALTALTLSANALEIPNELGAPKATESAETYKVIYGSVKVQNDLQRVIVTVPNSKGPHPAFMLIGGLGCYSVDFSGAGPHIESYKKIIEFMAQRGFVTMRVEKTGMGDSKGKPCLEQNFDRELAGFVAGAKALKSYSFVNPERVTIFGHSIGGVIAPLLIEQVPVHAAIVMGTLAERWYDYDRTNNIRQMYLANMTSQQITAALKTHDLVAKEYFINKKTPDEIIKMYPDGASFMQFPVHYAYMQQLADLDLETSWKKSEAKVFMILGKADFIGSQWEEIEKFSKNINSVRKVKIQTENMNSLDHYFRNPNTWAESFYNVSLLGAPLIFQDQFLVNLENKIPELK